MVCSQNEFGYKRGSDLGTWDCTGHAPRRHLKSEFFGRENYFVDQWVKPLGPHWFNYGDNVNIVDR